MGKHLKHSLYNLERDKEVHNNCYCQHNRGHNQQSKIREINKRHKDWKRRNKTVLFAGVMTVSTENPKIEIKREFSRHLALKLIYKSYVLYSPHELSKKHNIRWKTVKSQEKKWKYDFVSIKVKRAQNYEINSLEVQTPTVKLWRSEEEINTKLRIKFTSRVKRRMKLGRETWKATIRFLFLKTGCGLAAVPFVTILYTVHV